MKKLLVICGPTASGKTKTAVELAKKFNGELISADSRQVYEGMDIGTGKDLPKGAKFNFVNSAIGGFYVLDGVKVWGYDLVKPTEDFSISEFVQSAHKIIERILNSGKLPILVGGTGYYVKGVLDGIDTADIGRNPALRKQIQSLSIETLYEKLSQMDPLKAASMNISDKKNPRRLVRAIEIADSNIKNEKRVVAPPKKYDSLSIGIKDDNFREIIRKRVEKRYEEGILEEIKTLLNSGVNWTMQSMSSIGYRQWFDYLNGNRKLNESLDDWAQAEVKYFKRQMTWFRKDNRILWFNTGDPELLIIIENTVNKWYYAS